jgi:nicotinamidase-related amidase
MDDDLKLGPLTTRDIHLCVDMQRLFAEDTEWHTPWMERVLPNVLRIARAKPADTVFTRFIPARNASEATGTWVRYYERWENLTLDKLAPGLVDLVKPLADLVPPARLLDKRVYSPWMDPDLDRFLKARGCETLVVTGGETDVCVLASVLGAVDRGYRVVVVSDALCSSSDEVHDAAMALYHQRFGQQVETISTEAVLRQWPQA